MSDFDDFVRDVRKEKPTTPKLRGDDIVKKNEEYIAKHREAEYQRQKAESERKLKEAIAPHAQPPLDETARWARPSDLIRPGSVEPGLEYKPLSHGRIRIPERRLHDIHIINHCIVT